MHVGCDRYMYFSALQITMTWRGWNVARERPRVDAMYRTYIGPLQLRKKHKTGPVSAPYMLKRWSIELTCHVKIKILSIKNRYFPSTFVVDAYSTRLRLFLKPCPLQILIVFL